MEEISREDVGNMLGRWRKYLEKMEELSQKDGGNISRRFRKYLEKMEKISREDGGNISRRWRKGQVDKCGELPSTHCAQFWSPTTTFVAKIAEK